MKLLKDYLLAIFGAISLIILFAIPTAIIYIIIHFIIKNW